MFSQFIIVSTWVLIHLPALANHKPAICSVSQALKNGVGPPRQTKSPDNSNVLYVFNNNIYTDFGTAYKLILIPSYII